MKDSNLTIQPKTSCGVPYWWSSKGFKFSVKSFSKRSKKLILACSAGKIVISKSKDMEDYWNLSWEIVFCAGSKVNGNLFFRTEVLKAAFCLTNKTYEYSDDLIKTFGGESAYQGHYIRWKNFLNIPCPGTGYQGDPNISIYVDEEIKKAVNELLTM